MCVGYYALHAFSAKSELSVLAKTWPELDIKTRNQTQGQRNGPDPSLLVGTYLYWCIYYWFFDILFFCAFGIQPNRAEIYPIYYHISRNVQDQRFSSIHDYTRKNLIPKKEEKNWMPAQLDISTFLVFRIRQGIIQYSKASSFRDNTVKIFCLRWKPLDNTILS